MKYVGKTLPRIDALNMALGRTEYCADRALPDMLIAKTFRCPLVSGIVRSLDVSQARALPGVIAVATAEDIPGVNMHGIHVLDQNVLVPVGGRVRMQGEPLAIVAAIDERTALRAVELMHAEYEALPVIDDPEEACKPETPTIHDGVRFPKEYAYSHGDLEKGFAEADVVFEETYHTPRQEHAYIETEAGIAYYDYDGVLTLFSPSHEPFNIRHQVGRTLNIPVGKVRAIVPPLGGSFGGKQNMTVHLHAALLCYMTKRPVQMIWSREESLMMSTKRHPSRMQCRLGMKKDGMITAFDADFLLDGGAYTEHSPGVTMGAGLTIPGPYKIPALRVTGRAVLTNNPISGAFRGYGGPQGSFAIERLLNKAARTLQIDQAEIRRKNSLQMGDQPGCAIMVLDSKVTLIETIDKAMELIGELPKPSAPHKRVGRGIASSIPQFDVSAKPYNGLTGIGAQVELMFDGTVQVRTGIVEMGTGIRTALAFVAADELGVPLEKVQVVLSDTMLVPKAGPTVASRAMYTAGNAVKNAAEQLRGRLLARAGRQLGLPAHALEMKNERICVKSREEMGYSLKEFAANAFVLGENMVGYDWFVGTHAGLGHTFVSTVCDVEVDIETGETEILNLVTAHDVGHAINPLSVYGQLVGGAVQGVGWTMMENMQAADGKIVNTTLSEYYIPTALDIPRKTGVALIEDPYPTGPYGAKGVGEHAMYSITPAIINAIENAAHISLTEFPATAETVWRALRSKDNTVRK